jgi:hypothetical protein
MRVFAMWLLYAIARRHIPGAEARIFIGSLISGLKPGPISGTSAAAQEQEQQHIGEGKLRATDANECVFSVV